ncbi:MAG: 8-oxo-dGTP diphosphatase MutT, partial [Calditrichaeota bacterium]
MKRSPVAVVAAIIYDSRGKVLITKRPAHVHLGGLWEFPGGKVDPGENDEQALIREIREETGLAIRVKELYWREIAAFPEKTVRLHFYLCALTHEPQEIIPDEIDDYRWVSLNSLPAFRFPEADARLIDRL